MLGPPESIRYWPNFFIGELSEAPGAVQLAADHQEGGSAGAIAVGALPGKFRIVDFDISGFILVAAGGDREGSCQIDCGLFGEAFHKSMVTYYVVCVKGILQ